jgi:hypothetical protein
MIPDEVTEGIVDETGDKRCAHPVAGERIRDIVFAAAGIGLEDRRQLNPLVARRGEANHAFAKGDKIIASFLLCFYS